MLVAVWAVDIAATMDRTPPIVAVGCRHCLDRRCLSLSKHVCASQRSGLLLCALCARHCLLTVALSGSFHHCSTTSTTLRSTLAVLVLATGKNTAKAERNTHTKTQRQVSTCSASRDVRGARERQSGDSTRMVTVGDEQRLNTTEVATATAAAALAPPATPNITQCEESARIESGDFR